MPTIEELEDRVKDLEDKVQTLEVDKTIDDRSFKVIVDGLVEMKRNIRSVERMAKSNRVALSVVEFKLKDLGTKVDQLRTDVDVMTKILSEVHKILLDELKVFTRELVAGLSKKP